NDIGPEGAGKLAEALMSENCKLQHLDLIGNQIGDDVMQVVNNALLNAQRRASQPLFPGRGEGAAQPRSLLQAWQRGCSRSKCCDDVAGKSAPARKKPLPLCTEAEAAPGALRPSPCSLRFVGNAARSALRSQRPLGALPWAGGRHAVSPR
ncbi:hypothetical protein CYMTET_56832, partial [Cymbomonas tetramitiformis]